MITCLVRTNFLQLDNRSAVSKKFPNQILIQHSNQNQIQIEYFNICLDQDSDDPDATVTAFRYFYRTPGTFNLSIVANETNNQIFSRHETILFQKTFNVGQVNSLICIENTILNSTFRIDNATAQFQFNLTTSSRKPLLINYGVDLVYNELTNFTGFFIFYLIFFIFIKLIF